MSPRKATARAVEEESVLAVIPSRPEVGVSDPVKALKLIREDIGDCTRCRLAKQGRKQIVFGVGNPQSRTDVHRRSAGGRRRHAGRTLRGPRRPAAHQHDQGDGDEREQVYIANIIKCRPPKNRTPERDECETCSPFLMRQIATIQPKVIVALGAVAAKTLLAINDSMSNLRGRWYDFSRRRAQQ